MTRRPRWREGDVYEIALANGKRAYAALFESPLAGFFSGVHDSRPTDFGTIAFYAMVHHDALSRWAKVAKFVTTPNVRPWFFKQDAISKKLWLRQPATGVEKPASDEDVMQHEPAVIWNPEQIEERLDREHGPEQFSVLDEMRRFAIRTAP